MKSILIVSRTFYPENSPRSLRTTELAKELAHQGHTVTVLTPKKIEHKAFAQTYGLTIKDLGQPKWKQTKLKGKGIELFLRRALRRLAHLIFFYPDIEQMFLVRKALLEEKGYDALISIAAPHSVHWGVAWARNKKHTIAKTWIADCGDPFMGLKNDTFKKLFYFRYLEDWFLKKADYIAIPIKQALNAYNPKYKEKMRVIPQGFYFPELSIYEKNEVPTFVYSGSIRPYMHYANDFFDFLKKTYLKFNFIVFTRDREIFETALPSKSDFIDINPYVERDELIRVLSKADFLVHFPYQDDSQGSLKLIDYHYSERPILSYKGTKDDEVLTKFFNGKYNNKLESVDIDIYKIENVAKQFISLTDTK